MSLLTVVAVVAIIIYTIARQVIGEPIRAKRLIILPAVLCVIGVADLTSHSVHATGKDIGLIAAGAVIAALIGASLGLLMRLERRDGFLWGQLPKSGLWLWLGLYASRAGLIGVAYAMHAHVAQGVQADLLILGINRIAQAAVVATRAAASGIPFAPESDGSTPLAGIVTAAEQFRGPQAPNAAPAPTTHAFGAAQTDRRDRRDARRARRGR